MKKTEKIETLRKSIVETKRKYDEAKKQNNNIIGIVLANPPPAMLMMEYKGEVERLQEELRKELENV